MKVSLALTREELRKISPVLLQLRPQYTTETLIEQIQQQQESGYQLAYVEKEDQILCVAGFVISEKLAWGKHLYIDDLVTDESSRGTGAGSFLINWLKAFGKSHSCQQIHLDSGVQRFSAHKFYLRENFNIASHHFSITDLTK